MKELVKQELFEETKSIFYDSKIDFMILKLIRRSSNL